MDMCLYLRCSVLRRNSREGEILFSPQWHDGNGRLTDMQQSLLTAGRNPLLSGLLDCADKYSSISKLKCES